MLTFHDLKHLLQPPLLNSYSRVQAVAIPWQYYGARSTRSSSSLCVTRPERVQELQTDAEDRFDENDDDGEEDESPAHRRFRRRGGEEEDYDKDPEFAEILGSCLDDPQKARSKMEERVRKKRNKILQTKTGSAKPMKVTFNK